MLGFACRLRTTGPFGRGVSLLPLFRRLRGQECWRWLADDPFQGLVRGFHANRASIWRETCPAMSMMVWSSERANHTLYTDYAPRIGSTRGRSAISAPKWVGTRGVPPEAPQISGKLHLREYKFFVCNVMRLQPVVLLTEGL